jgi:S1-C subfamily serine protease
MSKVLGINSLRMTANDGREAEGISFAIPSNYVKRVLAEFRAHNCLRRPYVGLALVALDKNAVADIMLDSSFRLPSWLTKSPPECRNSLRGMLVHKVEPGPAGDAGLVPGDVIVAVDDVKVESTTGWMAAIAFKLDGVKIKLSVMRSAKDGLVEDLYVTPTVREDISDSADE